MVIIDELTKMIYYKSIKVTIYVFSLAKLIINIETLDYSLHDSTISNQNLVLNLTFYYHYIIFSVLN